MPFEVDPARPSDVPAVRALFARILADIPYYPPEAKEFELDKYRQAALRAMVDEEPPAVLLAREPKDAPMGFALLKRENGTVWIDWFGVDASARRRGAGTALVGGVLAMARKNGDHKVWCDTRSNNKESIAVLKRLGFAKVGELKNHWWGLDFLLWERIA